MTTVLILSVLTLVLCTRRDVGPEARTARQILAGLRELGWKRATARGLAGLAVVFGLVVASVAIASIGATLKGLHGLALVLAAIGWCLADLIGWHPITLREAQ